MTAKSFYIFIELLKKIQSENNFKMSLVDVGCGHGKYSIIADILDFEVTGIDARQERIPTKYDNVKWILQNLRETNFNYDIILLSGILYHLDLESQINLIKKINNSKAKYIILNTHTCLESKGILLNEDFRDKLSGIVEINNFRGCFYTEGTNLKNRPMAAFDNSLSFWHTENSLKILFENWKLNKIDFITKDRFFYLLTKN